MNKTGIFIAIASLGVAAPNLALAQAMNDNDHGARPRPSGAESTPAQRPDDAATGERDGGRFDARRMRAAGGAVLSPERAARIADLLSSTSAPQHIAVDARVGAPLPGEVDVEPLPGPVVDLVPEFRGFEYAVAGDRFVIVEPSTRRVVEVIDDGGGGL